MQDLKIKRVDCQMRSAIWSGIWNHNYCDSTDTIAGRFESQKLTMGLTTKLTTGIDHEKTPQTQGFTAFNAIGPTGFEPAVSTPPV